MSGDPGRRLPDDISLEGPPIGEPRSSMVMFVIAPDGFVSLMAGAVTLDEDHPSALVGVSAWEHYASSPTIIDGLRRAMAGDAVDLLTPWAGRTWEIHYRPRVEQGELIDVFGVALDVTSRLDAEAHLEATAAWYRSIAEHAFEVAMVADADLTLRWASPAVEGVFGVRPDELLGRPGLDLVHPDDRARVRATVDRLTARPGASALVQFRAKAGDGRAIWIEETITNRLHDPAVRGFVGNMRDITGRRQAEAELEESEARFRGHFSNTLTGQAITDLEGVVLEVNTALCEMLGRERNEILGRCCTDFSHPDDVEMAQHHLGRLARGEVVSVQVEKRFVRADGSILHTVVSYGAVRTEGGVRFLTAVIQDMTEQRRMEEELRNLAMYDSLTGLANRTLLRERLERIVVSGSDALVLLLDLDDFKAVNDSYGHAAGDELLQVVSCRLQSVVAPIDTVARLGGDEFVVVVEEETESSTICADIEDALRAPVQLSGIHHAFTITASIGVATTPAPDAGRLLGDADAAMYRSKELGGARWTAFDETLHHAAVERLTVAHDLRSALANDELRVIFQPILSVPDERVIGAEALVRWQHPTRGLLSPDRFIPAAESTGLIIPLGSWVLHEATRIAAGWGEGDDGPSISVNLSAAQLKDPQLPAVVSHALAEARLPPARLVLEITESAVMQDAETSLGLLRSLKALGVKLAIDDFGTGYSSLAYVKRLPVDALKIDRAFVSGLGVDADDEPIVRAIIALADAVGLITTAEGVETAEQLDVLRRLGCPTGQGFYWARPGSPEAFDDMRRGQLPHRTNA